MNSIFLRIFIIGLCYGVNACDNSTKGTKSPLFDFQVKHLIKKAENGDGVAQAKLAEYFTFYGSESDANFWFEKCLKLAVPSCVVNVEGVNFREAILLPQNSSKRMELLINAKDNLDRAVKNGYDEGVDEAEKVKILRELIKKEITQPTPPNMMCKNYQICKN
jgi:hypothetical protein